MFFFINTCHKYCLLLSFFLGEESLKFGGVNFQRTESGRFINKNGQELSNDAMAASRFYMVYNFRFLI